LSARPALCGGCLGRPVRGSLLKVTIGKAKKAGQDARAPVKDKDTDFPIPQLYPGHFFLASRKLL
jgi:hypothetical protein